MRQRYDYLYENLNLRFEGKGVLSIHMAVILRQLLQAFCITIMTRYNYFQLMLINFISVGMLIFIGQMRPYKGTS